MLLGVVCVFAAAFACPSGTPYLVLWIRHLGSCCLLGATTNLGDSWILALFFGLFCDLECFFSFFFPQFSCFPFGRLEAGKRPRAASLDPGPYQCPTHSTPTLHIEGPLSMGRGTCVCHMVHESFFGSSWQNWTSLSPKTKDEQTIGNC